MESPTIGKLAEALAKAQAQMEAAKKDSLNPHFKNKYADIASILDAIRDPVAKHGLSYVQFPEVSPTGYCLTTKIMHSSGEWISGSMPLLFAKNDMQGLGGALTYARRYSLSAFFGVAQEDDDGNSVSNIEPKAIPPAAPHGIKKPSESQINRLYTICQKHGLKNEESLNEILFARFQIHSVQELTLDQYKLLCDFPAENLTMPKANLLIDDLPPGDMFG